MSPTIGRIGPAACPSDVPPRPGAPGYSQFVAHGQADQDVLPPAGGANAPAVPVKPVFQTAPSTPAASAEPAAGPRRPTLSPRRNPPPTSTWCGRTVLGMSENACPGLDPGWPPVPPSRSPLRRAIGKDRAQSKPHHATPARSRSWKCTMPTGRSAFHDDQRRDFRRIENLQAPRSPIDRAARFSAKPS